jgi:plastocyanin
MRIATIFGTTAIAAIAAFSGCGGDDDASPGATSRAAGDGDTIEVEMLDNFFRPDQITVPAGATVTFDLPNKGKLPHNMHIASARGVYRESPWLSEPGITNGGERGQLTWEVPSEPGTYKFRCDIHEADMIGTITVE